MSESVSIIPLGGVDEIGKNLMVYEARGEILIVDCGFMFPDEEMLGVDIVIPDMTYLFDNADRISGVFLTHGHEDHIGAMPYLLQEMRPPIYGTRLTLGILCRKLREFDLGPDDLDLHEVRAGEVVRVGEQFEVECVAVCHSIPDALALGIHTPAGLIVHSGDFKFDQTPVDGRHTDIHRLARFGSDGVLALLSDCTNVENPGYTPSEATVGAQLLDVFQRAPSRVFIATFSSNVHRLQQVIDVSYGFGRKVAAVGRSMLQTIEVAAELGYLSIPDGTLVDLDRIDSLPREQVTLLTTGSQGEPLSALTLMARQDHKRLQIAPGDTVIISATAIPGNEALIMRTINELYRQGAEVIYEGIAPVHVSGHGNQEDLRLMLNLTRPKWVVPYHGEHRMLVQYGHLAASMDVPDENIRLIGLGDRLEVSSERCEVVDSVAHGTVMIDGLGIGDVGTVVLRDRKHLAEDGFIVVVVSIDKETGELLAGPEIMSRGFVYVKEAEQLIEAAQGEVVAALAELREAGVREAQAVKDRVRQTVNRFVYQETKRRPMVLPVLQEV